MDAVAFQKRPRGRPPGSGINDGPTLSSVADILVANPRMRPTTAMKRCVKGIQPSHLRRLQGKWAHDGAALLKEALQRVQAKKEAEMQAAALHQASNAMAIATGHGSQQVFDLICNHRIHDFLTRIQRIRDVINPPALQRIQELQQRMTEMANHPALRVMQDFASSPLLREFQRTQEIFAAHAQLVPRQF